MAITVTGYQWWWGIDYKDPNLQAEFSTANEMHIPVGKTVRVTLVSADVIHSFWVPQLQGKMDVIPGDTNEVRLFASRPGDYRGQCAEFCGAQHAHMAMHVIADEPAAFQRWIAAQRQSAAAPSDTLAARGAQLFQTGACALCHTVRGTAAAGMIGPDLTHVGSRATIAAGTLANTTENLDAWIANAPSLKPGTRMPALPQLSAGQVHALSAYLKSLR
jgi:Heme/copper-type cytochrome/quinol oxidases, subunit 2